MRNAQALPGNRVEGGEQRRTIAAPGHARIAVVRSNRMRPAAFVSGLILPAGSGPFSASSAPSIEHG